jgi:hypothetical protein
MFNDLRTDHKAVAGGEEKRVRHIAMLCMIVGNSNGSLHLLI